MPLKILFADDSATAQTMGIKILTEAGYEVVAVSNGSAALKKIAEQTPDIAILDVWMPGYNGLEVCEKMRSSVATLNTPVLLTVGKMEAYRNEDTNRVKADGIIVKPFEASDLLAIVKRLEEQIFQTSPQQSSPPQVEHTLYLERPTLLTDQHPREDFSVDAGRTSTPQDTASKAPEKPHSAVEIPDHMAAAPVFNDTTAHDFSAQHVVVAGPETAIAEQPAPEPVAALSEPIPLTAWKWEPDFQTEVDAAGHGSTAEASHREASPRETQIMPAYQEPAASNQPGVMMDSAPEEAAVPPPPVSVTPALELTSHHVSESAASAAPVEFLQEHAAIHDGVDPALVTDRTRMTEFATRFGVDNAEVVPVGVYAEQSWPEAPTAEVEPPHAADAPAAESEMADVSAEDFEARVAAAMTAYDQTEAQPQSQPEAPPLPSAVEAQQPETHPLDHGFSHQQDALVNPAPEVLAPAAPVEVVLPEPPVSEPPVPEPPVAETAVPESSLPEPPAANNAVAASELQTFGDAVSTYSAPDAPVAVPVAAAAMVGDPEAIAQAVARVMERLKPMLIEEIMRELNSIK